MAREAPELAKETRPDQEQLETKCLWFELELKGPEPVKYQPKLFIKTRLSAPLNIDLTVQAQMFVQR